MQVCSCNLISHLCMYVCMDERESVKSVKLAAAILWQAAKLSAVAHFDWADCV